MGGAFEPSPYEHSSGADREKNSDMLIRSLKDLGVEYVVFRSPREVPNERVRRVSRLSAIWRPFTQNLVFIFLSEDRLPFTVEDANRDFIVDGQCTAEDVARQLGFIYARDKRKED